MNIEKDSIFELLANIETNSSEQRLKAVDEFIIANYGRFTADDVMKMRNSFINNVEWHDALRANTKDRRQEQKSRERALEALRMSQGE